MARKAASSAASEVSSERSARIKSTATAFGPAAATRSSASASGARMFRSPPNTASDSSSIASSAASVSHGSGSYSRNIQS